MFLKLLISSLFQLANVNKTTIINLPCRLKCPIFTELTITVLFKDYKFVNASAFASENIIDITEPSAHLLSDL